MEISISMLVEFNILLAFYAVVSGVAGWIIVAIDQTATKGKFNLRQAGIITKVGMACTLLCVFGLAVSFAGFIISGIWWIWESVFENMTPGRLAIISLILGPSPMLLPMLAKIICKITGGEVDASQARKCNILGLNLNGLVHTLFMSYILVLLTGGLAVFGLIGSGVWTLVKMF